jgi:regulator of protease activity HflC (stomatin/prohibitin superfamily)
MGLLIVIGVVVLIALFAIISSIVITKQKTSKIVTVLGKYSHCTSSGLSFKTPFISSIDAEIGLFEQTIRDSVGIKSKDNVFLEIPWSLQFKVLENKIKEAYYELDNPEGQMKTYVTNTLRGEASKLTMDELFESNKSFDDAVKNILSEKFGSYGYEIVNVLIDEPQPSNELKTTFNNVIASAKELEANKNEVLAHKLKVVGKAEADAEALTIKGVSMKEFRTTIASGNSEAVAQFLKGVDDSVNASSVLAFLEKIDLNETIKEASKNESNTIVIPADFANKLTVPLGNNQPTGEKQAEG